MYSSNTLQIELCTSFVLHTFKYPQIELCTSFVYYTHSYTLQIELCTSFVLLELYTSYVLFKYASNRIVHLLCTPHIQIPSNRIVHLLRTTHIQIRFK